jgi:hypothetical protein
MPRQARPGDECVEQRRKRGLDAGVAGLSSVFDGRRRAERMSRSVRALRNRRCSGDLSLETEGELGLNLARGIKLLRRCNQTW